MSLWQIYFTHILFYRLYSLFIDFLCNPHYILDTTKYWFELTTASFKNCGSFHLGCQNLLRILFPSYSKCIYVCIFSKSIYNLKINAYNRMGGVDWMHMAQDRDQWQALVNTVINPQVPWKVGNFLTRWVTVSFSRRTLLHGVKWRTKCSKFVHYQV
jgi:hypothetical protein